MVTLWLVTMSLSFSMYRYVSHSRELISYRTSLLQGSSVSHSMVAAPTVLSVTVGGLVILGAVRSGSSSVLKVISLEIDGPFPAASVVATLK